MDQIEGGTLVVNSANPATNNARPTDGKAEDGSDNDEDARDLNVIDGLSEGWKLAEVRGPPRPASR